MTTTTTTILACVTHDIARARINVHRLARLVCLYTYGERTSRYISARTCDTVCAICVRARVKLLYRGNALNRSSTSSRRPLPSSALVLSRASPSRALPVLDPFALFILVSSRILQRPLYPPPLPASRPRRFSLSLCLSLRRAGSPRPLILPLTA